MVFELVQPASGPPVLDVTRPVQAMESGFEASAGVQLGCGPLAAARCEGLAVPGSSGPEPENAADGKSAVTKQPGAALDSWLDWQPPNGGKPVLRTLLMIAAHQGSSEALSFLLRPSTSRGANCNAASPSDGATALHCACEGASANCFQVITLLLEAGADKDAVDHQGRKAVDLLRSAMESSQAGSSTSAASSSGASCSANSSGMESSGELGRCAASSSSDDEGCAADGSSSSGSSTTTSSSSSSIDEECALLRPEYCTDDFRMFRFKVEDCPNMDAHDWTECPFAHPGEKARRRDPSKYQYTGTACPDFRKGSCKRGDACTYAHGVFECWLHPNRYKTQLCKDAPTCTRRVCFFAHQISELRAPEDATTCISDPASAAKSNALISEEAARSASLATAPCCGPDTSGTAITIPRLHPSSRRRGGNAAHVGALGALAVANGLPVGSNMLRATSLPLHTSFGSLSFGSSDGSPPHISNMHHRRARSRHAATAATAAAAAAAAAAAVQQQQQAQLLAALEQGHALQQLQGDGVGPLLGQHLGGGNLHAQAGSMHASALAAAAAAAAAYASAPLVGLPLPLQQLQPAFGGTGLPHSSPFHHDSFAAVHSAAGLTGLVGAHGMVDALSQQQRQQQLLRGAPQAHKPHEHVLHASSLDSWHSGFDAAMATGDALQQQPHLQQQASHPGLLQQQHFGLPSSQQALPLQHLAATMVGAYSQPLAATAALGLRQPVPVDV